MESKESSSKVHIENIKNMRELISFIEETAEQEVEEIIQKIKDIERRNPQAKEVSHE